MFNHTQVQEKGSVFYDIPEQAMGLSLTHHFPGESLRQLELPASPNPGQDPVLFCIFIIFFPVVPTGINEQERNSHSVVNLTGLNHPQA